MSQKSQSYFTDILNERIQKQLAENPTELLESKTYYVDLDSEDLLAFFIDSPEDFVPKVRRIIADWCRQYNYPISSKDVRIILDTKYFLIKKIRDLKSDSYNKPVCFDAIVVGEGQIKSYIKKATFYCTGCSKESVSEVALVGRIEEPRCGKCKEQTLLFDEKCEYGEVKDVILREPFEESVDKQPIEYGCKVRDEMIGKVTTGCKLRIVGVKRAVINKKGNEHLIEIRIISYEDLQDPKDADLSPKEVAFFEREVQDPEFDQKLVESFSPDIFCAQNSTLWYIKYSTLLFLAKGKKVLGKREVLNLWLCGDPGTAKSSIMKFAVSISPRSMYVSGNGASDVGLTAIIEKQADGRFMAKAGVLPMCDEGFAAIDEMNLMKPEDQNALQETMENQFVTKAKAVSIVLPARCGIIGGANPIHGKYDFDKSVIDNTEMAIPLLNRFDMKFCVPDKVDVVLDTAIANHILEYQDNPKKILESVPYPKPLLIKYLNYVRKQDPEISKDSQKAIISFVNKIRALTNHQGSMPVDRRIIESLSRMVVARAKHHLKKHTDVSDVEFIANLYLKSLESFGIDVSTEPKQEIFYTTHDMNQNDSFWKVFDSCKDSEGTVDMVEVIAKLAETKHFDEYKAKSFFEKMSIKKLTELRSGRWRKIDQ